MTDLATAYANAGKALLDLADAIAETIPPPSEESFDALAADWPGPEAATSEAKPAGSAAAGAGSASVCPSHNIAYLPGRKGPYCPAQSTEPNWSYVSRKNGESYCAITPKSAAAWLRQHA